MSTYISLYMRDVVVQRAHFRCEYCHIPDIDSYYGFHIDHIISQKHGGLTILLNLAYACPDCNRYKGSDLGTYLSNTLVLTRFFHPRVDIWDEHFETDSSGLIMPKTDIGKATVNIFTINHPDRIIERQLLWKAGLMS